MARFLNPYTDFGFKKLFGEEASKDLHGFEIAELGHLTTEQRIQYEMSLVPIATFKV